MAQRFAVLVAGVVLASAVCGGDALGVVGGRPISVRSAPWAVFVRATYPHGEHDSCSGSIIDARHVLTAAHCLFGSNGDFATKVTIEAGVSNYKHPRSTDTRQERKASSLRVEPGYVNREPRTDSDTAHDLAVLTVSPPLDLGGSASRAVTLPSGHAPLPAGGEVVLAGFGEQVANRTGGGALELMQARIISTKGCVLRVGDVLCASSRSSGVCYGDSGAGLIRLIRSGPVPMLVGVLSEFVGKPCTRGSNSKFVDLNAAPARLFVHGNSRPGAPPEPRATRWVPSGWTGVQSTYRGQLIPLVYAVPRVWSAAGPGGGMRESNIGAGAENTTTPHPGSKARYYAAALKRVRALARKVDPHAVVRSRIVKLPGATALEIITELIGRIGQRPTPQIVENYCILHEGVGYEVEYFMPRSVEAIDSPIFDMSARTIHFRW